MLREEIEILDKNFNIWFKFKLYDYFGAKSIYLTKNFLIVLAYNKFSYIIKRKSKTNYESLENDY